MKKIELNIIALSNSESHKGNYALILEENNGFRRLPIIIGLFEAQAIAIAIENMQPSRPQTHDLLKNALLKAGVRLKEILIARLEDNIFHSIMIGQKNDGTRVEVDARTSDAIAMAVRFGCPIFTTAAIMDEAAIVLDSPSKAFTNKRGSLSEYSLEELERLLEKVLAKEDYQSAVKIREAIKKKKGGKS